MADSNPYNNPYYAQYQAQTGSTNPYAANPYYAYPSAAAGPSKPLVANAHEYDVGAAAQQSAYVPGAHTGKGAAGVVMPKGQKRKTVLRKGGGKLWEDPTLLEWDSSWFRLFVGDVSNDVTDEILSQAFAKYATFTKARVIRDKLSAKAKYGFVAFSDPEDFLRAWKEMDGKYVGNRPIRLKKAEASVNAVDIGHNKAKQLAKFSKDKRHKPY